MKKIIVIVPIIGSGGVEVFSHNLHNYLKDTYEVIFVGGIKYSDKNWNKLSPKYNLGKYFGPSKSKLIGLAKNVKKIYALRKIMAMENPNVIISMEFSTTIVTKIATIGLNNKIIAIEHSNPKYGNNIFYWRALKKIIYPFIDYIVCVSKGVAENYRWIKNDKLHVIYNAISERWYQSKCLPNDEINSELYICFAGRLSHEKNLNFLLDCFQGVLSKLPKVKLYIIGSGELKDDLQKYAVLKNVDSNVRFIEHTEDLQNFIVNSRFVVLTSLTEGFPLVLVEALASGIPVVTTDCDYGPREIVNHENGFLVPLGESELYTSAMISMFEDDAQYRKMKSKARSSVMHLSPKITKEKWLNLLQIASKE